MSAQVLTHDKAQLTRLMGYLVVPGKYDSQALLRAIGEESRRKGTDKLTSRQIDQVIKAARTQKTKRG